jgi:drug/metabolite transporter (DMT)-like permease
VAIYWLASRRIRRLTEHPVRFGLLYGVVAYLVMTFVVVPLSAFITKPPTLPNFLNGTIGHALLVGLPSAYFARRARSASDEARTGWAG